ncbi:MAG: TetR/AcrR family transcriptional regulator [Pseudomonadota bacterium]
MTIPTTKRRQSEKTIAAIMDAATRLFVSSGYHGASIAAISEAAHLTKGALYSHFAGKSDLLLALIKKFEREFLDGLIASVGEARGGAVEKLHRFVSFSAGFAESNPELCLLLTTISTELGGCDGEVAAELRRLYGKYAAFLETVIESGKEQGVFFQGFDTRCLAHTIIAVHDGVLLQWRRCRDFMDAEEFVRTFRRVLIQGVGAGAREDGLGRKSEDN